jgi:hypothetical protein
MDAPPVARPPFEREELASTATALVQRLREGSLPPDDAYWWGRIVGHEARSAHESLKEQ